MSDRSRRKRKAVLYLILLIQLTLAGWWMYRTYVFTEADRVKAMVYDLAGAAQKGEVKWVARRLDRDFRGRYGTEKGELVRWLERGHQWEMDVKRVDVEVDDDGFLATARIRGTWWWKGEEKKRTFSAEITLARERRPGRWLVTKVHHQGLEVELYLQRQVEKTITSIIAAAGKGEVGDIVDYLTDDFSTSTGYGKKGIQFLLSAYFWRQGGGVALYLHKMDIHLGREYRTARVEVQVSRLKGFEEGQEPEIVGTLHLVRTNAGRWLARRSEY